MGVRGFVAKPHHLNLNLNGEWLLRRDPGNVGLAEDWPNDIQSLDAWGKTTLPGAWQRENDFGPEYHYLGWFRRTVRLPDDWDAKRTFIRFDSVATELTLWVNGTRIGSHTGDFLPFEFDISECATPGEDIEMVLRVDEQLGHLTKGFHDMLSIHHGGVWGNVSLIGSGSVHARPNGVAVQGEARDGAVTVFVEFDRPVVGEVHVVVRVIDEENVVAETAWDVPSGVDESTGSVIINHPKLWSPEDPFRYEYEIELHDEHGLSEIHHAHFGYRTVETHGEQIHLNGSPIHLRGILHWGHEPEHLAPAPPPDQVRAEFARLREMGFNCVCLCMWYPPEYYFEIADQTGMLIWQEHPNWHAPMDEEYLPEYRRLYTEFMRRDRQHPSVILVSATCEHPCFHPDLAKWWWTLAHEMLPDTLLQVQTSSFAWSNPDETDLYDEHTYDNNNRWITYLEDLQEHLGAMPTKKPFVMGESIVFNNWPDIPALQEKVGRERGERGGRGERAWWLPKFFEHAIELEKQWGEQYGTEVVEHFRRHSQRYHRLGRQFQIERFRSYPNHAGLVMNHLRDVPGCTCGFMDDLNRWRFEADETRPWLSDAPMILEMPEHRRSFASGETVEARILISNFSPDQVNGELSLSIASPVVRASRPYVPVSINAAPGEVIPATSSIEFPKVDKPTALDLRAKLTGLDTNTWHLWLFPESTLNTDGLYRLDGLPFSPKDAAPDEYEKGYSRGFGLPAKSWLNRLPDPAELLPDVPAWAHDQPIPDDAQTIITHKLTPRLIDWLEAGGRVVLLASKTKGSLPTRYEWMFGACPLVLEEQDPLNEGDSEWIVDLLGMDLTHSYCRVIPVDELGIADQVAPIVRLAYIHDQSRVRLFDQLFTTRVGKGVLTVSSLDHHSPAGMYVLHAILNYDSIDPPPETELDPTFLRDHALND